MSPARRSARDAPPLALRIGPDELVLRDRYELLSIGNDILVALWFVAGSVLFFWESTTTLATWLFVAGSVELLIRPVIRLARRVHLRRLPRYSREHGTESGYDF